MRCTQERGAGALVDRRSGGSTWERRAMGLNSARVAMISEALGSKLLAGPNFEAMDHALDGAATTQAVKAPRSWPMLATDVAPAGSA
jgi:hypothetical protein